MMCDIRAIMFLFPSIFEFEWRHWGRAEERKGRMPLCGSAGPPRMDIYTIQLFDKGSRTDLLLWDDLMFGPLQQALLCVLTLRMG